MNGQKRTVVIFMASSVIAMYIETILQVYVCITAQKISLMKSPAAIVSLSLALLSYIMSSVRSTFLAYNKMNFDGNLASKMIFRFFHLILLGLLWRIFKLIMSFSRSDFKDLAAIRLIHVGLQSSPYIIIYSSIFVSCEKVNAVQVLSLSSSAISTVLAVTCFNLRLKLCKDDALDGEFDTGKIFGCSRLYPAIVFAFIGTLLVMSTRFISLSLMASQEQHWIFLPLGCHILVLFVIFIGFSSRTKIKSKVLPMDYVKHCVYALGMAILNCFDLIHDNIERVMCKYVGFYSLILVENIVFLSFWLIRFEMDSAGKLFSVFGILIGFIVGLMVKFAGYNMIQQKITSSVDSPPQTTVLTISNISSNVSQNISPNSGDDLVSIVQASVYRQSLQTDSLPRKARRKEGRRKSADPDNDQQRRQKSREIRGHNRRHSTNVVRTSSGNKQLRTSHDIPSRIVSTSSLSAKEVFHRSSDSSAADKIDLDNSYQPDSMFNVSDPGTIRSDMMYDEDNIDDNDVPQTIRDLRQQMHRNEFLNPRTLQIGASRNLTMDMCNDVPPNSRLELGRIKNNRGLKKFNPLQNQNFESVEKNETKSFTGNFESLQPNECSDTAISSAKTFPMETKKSDLKGYDNALMYKSSLGRKMNKIIYSLEDSDKNDISLSKLKSDHLPPNAPNSDDDIFRYKYSSRSFHTPRNRISYTDGDDLSPSDNTSRSQHVEPKIMLERGSKSSKPSKRESQSQSHVPSSAVVISPSTLQLCESGSSSFSSLSFENKDFTKTSTSSSSSSVSTKHLCWADSGHQRREASFLPDEESQIPTSENILRWLAVAGAEDTDNEEHV